MKTMFNIPLSPYTIDLYIVSARKQSYKKGKPIEKMLWSKENWSLLKEFYWRNGFGELKQGDRFLGIKHYYHL